ncbi:MAG TPA: AAA family ATPase [Candidatus Woesearchaeota archaeon]|nr:AAA family ATPase [Candidatus Woesearchaeota archaeon]
MEKLKKWVNKLANIFETSNKISGIIKNEDILGYEYVPKKLPYREGQIDEIADAMKPMLNGSKGTNLFITGAPGIGKTASLKWILNELDDHTDNIIPIYINCWNHRTKYFIFTEIAGKLKVSFTMGKSAEHILQNIKFKLKNKGVVFVFDEIDKVEDSDFLYQIVSMFPMSCIILVSNSSDYLLKIEPRIKSRLMARTMNFKPYTLDEIQGILKERQKLGLRANSLDPQHLRQIAVVTHGREDVRVGLFLLKESAKSAEKSGRRKIIEEDIKELIKQLDCVVIGNTEKLSQDESMILEAVKARNGNVSGEVYDKYKDLGGELSYRSFKRYVKRMSLLDILKTEETGSGFKGKSTIISLN